MSTNAHKPWMKQPGELHDKKGVPIYPGDLIRSFHFRTRRRIYYLYHTAVYQDGAMRGVPTCDLEATCRGGGGGYLMSQDLLVDSEVIHGSGPGECLDHHDRRKVRLKQLAT